MQNSWYDIVPQIGCQVLRGFSAVNYEQRREIKSLINHSYKETPEHFLGVVEGKNIAQGKHLGGKKLSA